MLGSNGPPGKVRWLHKATYGFCLPALAELDALGSTDNARWQAWLDWQLAPGSINDNACDARLAAAGYTTLAKSLQQLWADHHAETDNYSLRMLPQEETECATLVRAVYSKRQLFERMVGFWHDHFSVYGRDYDLGPIFPSYDRDVIRPYALGNFRTLLEEVAKSTVMLYYLDNQASRGANFNENYARELMELHTLGAENYYGPDSLFDVPCVGINEVHCEGSMPAGYVDNDVYEVARCLTGWTVRNGHWEFPDENDGSFVYRSSWHSTTNKIVLGLYIPPNLPEMADGQMVFDRLCAHPGTARHVSGKLCRRFVGDHASAALIDSVAGVFQAQIAAPDQIAQMLRTILESNEFLQSWGGAIKRPFEATCSALRGLSANFTPQPDNNTNDWTTSEEFFGYLSQTGHRPFRWGPPNGYPDDFKTWSSTGSMAMTLKLLARLPELRQTDGTSPFLADVTAQTMAHFPNVADRTAARIIHYWSGRILGYWPTNSVATATAFLQQNAGNNEPIDITREDWEGNDLKNHYTQSRLRTAVGMLLMNPDYLRR